VTIIAFGLILVSAVVHATWNLVAKRLTGGGETVWLFTAAATGLYAPVAAMTVVVTGYRPNGIDVVFLMGTGILHAAYFVMLRRSYTEGDLSLVYPLARGSGPIVAMAIATVLIGERPTPLTIAGAAVISLGTVLLATPFRDRDGHQAGLLLGAITGALIGCYTAWDGYAVGSLAIPALLHAWAGDAGRLVLLTPIAYHRRARLGAIRGRHWRAIIAVAVLSTASYVMVLTAMSIAPISSIAPAREVSIVIAAIFGTFLLGERGGRRRLLSAMVITAGVGLVALG
jgi:drug/metabolite transporter (DMT)-like permease